MIMKQFLAILSFIFFFFSCSGGAEEVVAEESNQIDTVVAIDSMTYFNQKVDANPKSSDWRYKRAVFLLAKGDVPQSKYDLEQALRLDSVNMDARLMYANLHLSMTNLDTSKFHYEYILEKDTANTGALIGLSKLYALLDNPAAANAHISTALEINPNLAEAYFMRGIIYRTDYYDTGRKESWDRAVSSFQTTVEQDPDYYSAYIEMGVMYDQIKSDLALEYYNSALDIYPESQEAWYNIGMYHQTRGEVDQALTAYKKINAIDSTWADPYYNQGYIHLVLTEKLDSAIHYLILATDRDPMYFQAYNNLGLAYELSGDIPNAKKYYQKAIDANPDFQLAKDNLNSLR
jgi:tetratricopeptide (TPR) repeat protein